LQIAGIFPNTDSILRPGQYGRVRAQIQTKTNVVVVPQRAVSQLQGSYQVVVVDHQNKAHLQPVKVAEQTGSQWVIDSGLNPGDRVVVEGIQKAKEGTTMAPVSFIGQTNKPTSP
jgi:membrane fusion protein (multidrug efflux system)